MCSEKECAFAFFFQVPLLVFTQSELINGYIQRRDDHQGQITSEAIRIPENDQLSYVIRSHQNMDVSKMAKTKSRFSFSHFPPLEMWQNGR